ncbi:hypothetical protein [Clostridium sp. HMSC19A10]|uniref:hypothetical protein n=1 Tax=Clostridium sp. HMSC19A10 TaxID=1581148 RepID=UPI0008A24885|nr:hypothetical protein [Clostridium sp. HMSC19A10]OFS21577.1 hypothetical protein HMPREF3070_12600 [Clostridium sp. HMSC19A10]
MYLTDYAENCWKELNYLLKNKKINQKSKDNLDSLVAQLENPKSKSVTASTIIESQKAFCKENNDYLFSQLKKRNLNNLLKVPEFRQDYLASLYFILKYRMK